MTDRPSFRSFVGSNPWCLLSPASCLIFCLWSRFDLETISLNKCSPSSQPANRSGPISRAEERALGVKGHVKFTHTRSQRSWAERARLQSQFDEIRINRPLSNQSPTLRPLPPTPRLTLFPHLWSQPPFSLLFLFLSPLCHFSQTTPPHPASSTADALRCTCRQSEPSRGESRPLSARLLLSPVASLLDLTSRCESGSSVRAQQQIDWPSACNNIGSTDHFHPALHHHPAVPIFTPCCCYCRCLLLLLCCRCLD